MIIINWVGKIGKELNEGRRSIGDFEEKSMDLKEMTLNQEPEPSDILFFFN